MLVEVHFLEPICLSHYVYFARYRDEIPNHVLGPFLFPKELFSHCTFVDGIVDDDYS